MLKKKLETAFKVTIYFCLGMGILGAGLSYFLLQASLPLENGEVMLSGLTEPAAISRDKRGIPTITAANRKDIARLLGFIHGQERFFQMDLLRRVAAGELAELVGGKAILLDKSRRFHQFRKLSQQALKGLTSFEKEMLQAYSDGVNAGLSHLKARPFEYFLLRTKPAVWKPEDSLLVGYGLFLELQDPEGKYDLSRGIMQEALPESVFRFFAENGSHWEETLDGTRQEIIKIPGEKYFDYLRKPGKPSLKVEESREVEVKGSNQWAVSGSKTESGKALLACDMHLHISIPTTWYRASFNYYDEEAQVEIHGATLPGTPLMVVGSNRFIAWGFTNSYVDTTDIVLIPPQNKDSLIKNETDWILVKDQEPVLFERKVSPWGPVLEKQYLGFDAALLWTAHNLGALNMRLTEIESARSVKEVLESSRKIKLPLINLMAADSQGNIGWTLVGAIPNREGFDGKTPVLGANDGNHPAWNGFLDSAAYPTIYNPESGYLVTANNKVLGGKWKSLFWPSGFLSGARASQISKRLQQAQVFNEGEMLKIQLDDEALFLNRWKDLLVELLETKGLEHSRKEELASILNQWEGCCSADSSAYFWIRTFRSKVAENVLNRILRPCQKKWQQFNFAALDLEEPLWLIVREQPGYLRSSQFASWSEELFSSVKEMIAEVSPDAPLSQKTWGDQNVLSVRHPLSEAIPLIRDFLDIPSQGISGDRWVPKVIGPTSGASERMCVTPGAEEFAIFHSPAGQSGHPLSPHYRDRHENWLKGKPEPLMPGEAVSSIRFSPQLD